MLGSVPALKSPASKVATFFKTTPGGVYLAQLVYSQFILDKIIRPVEHQDDYPLALHMVTGDLVICSFHWNLAITGPCTGTPRSGLQWHSFTLLSAYYYIPVRHDISCQTNDCSPVRVM